MEKEKTKVKRKPPTKAIKSVQLDLFGLFITNEESHISNSIEVWERIPKYFFTKAQMEKLRTKEGGVSPFKWTYQENGQEYSVVIQPSFIEQEDGSFKAFFPSATEELVEEALKKILARKNQTFHDPSKQETWVKFSLSMISKELKLMGKERKNMQIKQAIAVMSRTMITFYKGKKEVWSGAILQDLVTVDREKYLEDTNAYHIGRLPLFVSQAIDRLETRQFNYERLMKCDQQLSRWIYKRLINRFKQASTVNEYHFKFSDLEGSGLLQQARAVDNRRKVMEALEELKEKDVLIYYTAREEKEGRKIVDVIYEDVTPSKEFIAEQKAANKRATENYHKALNSGWFLPVDN